MFVRAHLNFGNFGDFGDTKLNSFANGKFGSHGVGIKYYVPEIARNPRYGRKDSSSSSFFTRRRNSGSVLKRAPRKA